MASNKANETVECSKCGGSGEYLHFGKCFRCNGTGRHAPFSEQKVTAWWTKVCLCRSNDPINDNVFCSLHGFSEWSAAQEQLKAELRADAEYRRFQQDHGEDIWASAYEERANGRGK
jgi:hypothetical protein